MLGHVLRPLARRARSGVPCGLHLGCTLARAHRRAPSVSALQPLAEPASEILGELPGDAARARAPCHAPLQRVAHQLVVLDLELVVGRIAAHHVQVLVLAAVVEAEPEAEAVRQRHLLLHRLRRVDGGRALVLHHLARHQVAAVGGGVEDDVLGAPLDAAFEHGLERLVARVVLVEGEVVAEHDEAVRAVAQCSKAARQRGDVLAVDLDELQVGALRVELACRAACARPSAPP